MIKVFQTWCVGTIFQHPESDAKQPGCIMVYIIEMERRVTFELHVYNRNGPLSPN